MLKAMPIAHYIREIGRGRDGAKNLREADAFALMDTMLRGELSDLELGAAVLALRMKGESVDELAGFLRAAQAHCLRLTWPDKPVVVIPSYNGARKLPNLVPLLALLLAREGVPVLVHGVESDPQRVTTAQLFRALGLPMAADADGVYAAFARREPVFLRIERLSPALARLLQVRRVVGVRNSGHTVAKLLQPFATPALRIVNYTHPEYGDILAEFFTRIDGDVLLMRGTEGEAVADARRSQAIDWLSRGARTTLVQQQPGVLTHLPVLPRAIDAACTAAWIQGVLAGEHPVPLPIERQVEAVMQCASVLAQRAAEAPAAQRAAHG
jgi:anthranilate phosphoribosyltransferase